MKNAAEGKANAKVMAAFDEEVDEILKNLYGDLRDELEELETPSLREITEKELEPLAKVVNKREKLNENSTGFADKLLSSDSEFSAPIVSSKLGPCFPMSNGYELTPDEAIKICGVYKPGISDKVGGEDWDGIARAVFGDEWETMSPRCRALAKLAWKQEKKMDVVEILPHSSEYDFINFIFEFALKWNVLTDENAKWYLGRSKASGFVKAAYFD